MELRHLHYLLTVALEGNFTRAAEKLYVSQPALSQQIKQLEEELGTLLLDRNGRHIRLTAAGEIISKHARHIFAELDEAKMALQELEGLQRGSLVIGVVQTVNAYLIPPVVSRFTATYPAITLLIKELSADEIEISLQDGSLQLGIGFTPPTNTAIEGQPLFDEELVLLVSPEHPLATRQTLDVSELEPFPLILLPKSFCTRRLWDTAARQAGIEPKVLVEMNTISGILASLPQTKAATVLPRLALTNHQTALVAISLHHPTPSRSVGLLRRRNGYQCAATKTFAKMVQEIFVTAFASNPFVECCSAPRGSVDGSLSIGAPLCVG